MWCLFFVMFFLVHLKRRKISSLLVGGQELDPSDQGGGMRRKFSWESRTGTRDPPNATVKPAKKSTLPETNTKSP